MLHTLDYLKMLSSLKKLLILQEKYLFLDNLVFLLSINKYFLYSGHFFLHEVMGYFVCDG